MENIYGFRNYLTTLLFALILLIGINPEQAKADLVSTSSFSDTIKVYQDNTWTVVSVNPLTLSGFTITGANSVTWNSDNLLFYAIVKVAPSGRRLVTVDPSTGVCTDIGPLAGNYSSLTYNSTLGILYAIGGQGAAPAYAEKIFSLNINTAAETFLGGPYSVGADGEVIAFNYDDGYIYHWSGNSVANMEKINSATFVATPVAQSGVSHAEIWGAVYIGGNKFTVTDISRNAYTITPTGVVSLQQSGLNTDVLRGFGFVDALLPVELSSFTSSVTGRNATLNWSTVSETNNSGFEIERSGIDNQYNKVGFVNGNGSSNNVNNYSFTDRGLNSGKYNYRLKQIDFNGNFEYHNLNGEVLIGVPSEFSVSQNYPNPFNPSTKINFDIPVDGKVSITLYDISGKEMANLVNEVKTAGYYTVSFDASGLPSGTYFYRINSEGNGNSFTATKKMLLLK